MLRSLPVLLLIASLCGCMTLASPESFGIPEYVLAEHSSPDEVVALPPGGEIQVSFDSPDGRVRRRTTGTVLKATPEGVALFNCIVERRHERGPAGAHYVPFARQMLVQTVVGRGRYPVLWIPISEMGEVKVLAAPPEGYVSPDIPFEALPGEVPERLDSQGSLYRTHGGVI